MLDSVKDRTRQLVAIHTYNVWIYLYNCICELLVAIGRVLGEEDCAGY